MQKKQHAAAICSNFLGLAMAIVAPAASDAAMSSISQSNIFKACKTRAAVGRSIARSPLSLVLLHSAGSGLKL